MKEFIKKCPFVFSLLISTILAMDFYVVKYELIDLKLNQNLITEESKSGDDVSETFNEIEEDSLEAMVHTQENEKLQDITDDSVKIETDEIEQNENEVEVVEKEEEPVIGITEFVTYEPKDVHSPYYSDSGRKALTTEYPYSVVDESYFEDAAFIGDSRTIGLYDYAGFDKADFYADNGFCAYLWKKKGTVTLQNSHEKVNLEEAFSNKEYKKIYLMVGMNDCGYGNTDTFKETYEEMIEMLESKQPSAIIYLLAIMNVTKDKSDQQTVFTSAHINDKNVAIAECANGVNRFYLDYNDLYSDEEGYLLKGYSFDGIHLYGNKYEPWATFFKEHAVIKDDGAI